MAPEEAEDGQCPEKVGLKRKLTGPPRLLLGKKSKSQAQNRSEARAKRNKREAAGDASNAASSPKHSNAGVEETGSPGIAQDSPPGADKMNKEVSSESPEGHSVSEEVDTAKDCDIRSGKVKKRCWKRVFSPAMICIRRQRNDTDESPTGDCGQGGRGAAPDVQTKQSTLTEGKPTGEDAGRLDDKHTQDAPSNEKVMKGKKRFTIQTWPTLKRFLTSSYVHQRPERHGAHVVEELSEDVRRHPLTFRKKLQGFLTRGRRACSPVGHRGQEDGNQDPESQGVESQRSATQNKADQSAPDVQMDDILEDSTEVTEQCSEVVTVTAEMTARSPGGRASPEETHRDQFQHLISTEERAKADLGIAEGDSTDVESGPKMVQMDGGTKAYGEVACATNQDSSTHTEAVDIATDAHMANTDDASEIPSTEKEDVTESDTEIHYASSVAMATNYHLSIQVISSKEAPVNGCEQGTNGQLLTNGTSDGTCVSQYSPCDISCSTVAELDAENCSTINCSTVAEPDAENCSTINCSTVAEHTVNFSTINCSTAVESHGATLGGLEDGGWESSNSLGEHHDFADSESRLVQTAYSLVRAAMSAAMEQLSRERESAATNVRKEVQGCRDHA